MSWLSWVFGTVPWDVFFRKHRQWSAIETLLRWMSSWLKTLTAGASQMLSDWEDMLSGVCLGSGPGQYFH